MIRRQRCGARERRGVGADLHADEPHVGLEKAGDPVREQVRVHVAQVLVDVHPGPAAQQGLGEGDSAVGEEGGGEVDEAVVLVCDADVFCDGGPFDRLPAAVALVGLLLEYGADGGAVGAVRGEEPAHHILRHEVAGQDQEVGLRRARGAALGWCLPTKEKIWKQRAQ